MAHKAHVANAILTQGLVMPINTCTKYAVSEVSRRSVLVMLVSCALGGEFQALASNIGTAATHSVHQGVGLF